MCVNQKCMSIDSLRAAGRTCPNNCNNNGICNSLGHCHCKDGFAPPLCDYPGFGGSEDSGPTTDPEGIIIIIIVILLIIVNIPKFIFSGKRLCNCHVYNIPWNHTSVCNFWILNVLRETQFAINMEETIIVNVCTKFYIFRFPACDLCM